MSEVKVEIYSTTGVLLATPVSKRVQAGMHREACDVGNFKPGVYYVRYITPSMAENKKVIVY